MNKRAITVCNQSPPNYHSEYRIRGIIGESNIWRFAVKMQLARFLIGGFEYCVERNPCLQPKWRTFNLRDLPNCQIKTTAKYTMYTVFQEIHADLKF